MAPKSITLALTAFLTFLVCVDSMNFDRHTPEQDSKSDCDHPCFLVVKTVCGAVYGLLDYTEYTNSCYLSVAQCKDERIKSVTCCELDNHRPLVRRGQVSANTTTTEPETSTSTATLTSSFTSTPFYNDTSTTTTPDESSAITYST